jgi:ACR3 family arsenite efflux pump ArsB
MNKLQKIVFFNLCLAAVGLLLQLLHLLVSDLPIRLIASVLSLILIIFLAVSYFNRRKLAKQGGSQYDERDSSIHKTAILIGLFSLFFVIFVAILTTFIALGPGSSIEIGVLFGIFHLGVFSLCIAESLTVLIKYGWKDNDSKMLNEQIFSKD